MKRYLQIGSFSRREVGDSIFDQAKELVSVDETPGGYLRFKMHDEDPRLRRFQNFLSDHGIKPWHVGQEFGAENYECTPEYEFDQQDLDRADYFRGGSQDALAESTTLDGQRAVKVNFPNRVDQELYPGTQIAVTVMGGGLFATPGLANALQEAGMVGLKTRPTIAYLQDEASFADNKPVVIDWSEATHGPWVELLTDVVLPPMHPDTVFLNDRGEPSPPDTSGLRKGWIQEGRFPRDVFHYRKKDISTVQPFDVATPIEPHFRTQVGDGQYQPAIFSRRFYDLCNEMGVDSKWIPVYVDNE